MPTIYSSIDTGAPTYSNGTTAALGAAAVKAVLKGCLVNGYQGKPGAGWSLVAEDANYLILRNGSGTGYICFTFTTAYYMKITLAATFTGVVNDIITGAGVKTGVAANNTAPQWLLISSISQTSQFSWSVIADEKSVALTWYYYSSNNGQGPINMTTSSTAGITLLFGEDSGGNFLAVGGYNVANSASANNYFSASGMTVLRDPATGLLIDTGSISPNIPLLTNQADTGTTVYPLEHADLIRLPWMTTSKEGGYLRGLAIQPAAQGYLNYAMRSVGRAVAVTDFSLSNAANPFELVPGLKVVPCKDNYAHPGIFITDDARFW
ncbi:hypothetical protein QO209_10875 [Pseudomonas citronellolis]|uniref:hypothetical protein n=1 Tax=Pseudomonas citronellolis TaxID=53408 RepID=UPI002649887E|nr:hypothetical protein [Pseudomonas citronellolis]MDN6872949.1 hypothetical protein [Pseudomonas citronellolis]